MEEQPIEKLIAEAEERGYRRGLNEQIEQQMKQPGVWEAETAAPTADTAPTVLANRPRSIWDA